MDASIRIVRGSAGDVDRLQRLWLEMHRAHREAMPELEPYADDAASWARRRAFYERLLAQPDTVLLLALDGEELVGYGLSQVQDAAETWADTWQTGPRVAEIESLSVLPARRGSGIGGKLLDRLEAENAAIGVTEVAIAVLPGNRGAARLYERRGLRPALLYMTRFARPPER